MIFCMVIEGKVEEVNLELGAESGEFFGGSNIQREPIPVSDWLQRKQGLLHKQDLCMQQTTSLWRSIAMVLVLEL